LHGEATEIAAMRAFMPQPAGRGADDIRRGIGYTLIAVLLFSAVNAAAKQLAERYPILEIVFFRSLFALVPCLVMVIRAGNPRLLATQRPWSHATRAATWFGSVTFGFLSYHLLPLADAVAISFSGPLFLTALSVPILGERVGRHRWGAVIAGFLGVLVMVHPSGDVVQWGSFAALANALFFAFGSLTVRDMSRTEPSVRIVFYTMLVAAVLSGIASVFLWVQPGWLDLLMLAGVGIAGGIAQFWTVQAYRCAPPSAVAPFTYTSMVWAILFQVAIWNDWPTAGVLLGAAIVIASGLYILHRETRKRAPVVQTAASAGD
jgi:drug/metabolite transporter (DMT)-like permease